MITAFQIGAFQFNAFQEERGFGAGDWRPWIVARVLARAKFEREPDYKQVAALLGEAKERTRLLLKPTPYVVTDLGPALEAMREKEEISRFKQIVAELLALDDWADAA